MAYSLRGLHDLFKLPFQNKSLPSAEGFDYPGGKVFFWGLAIVGLTALRGKPQVKIRGKFDLACSVMTPVAFQTACSTAHTQYHLLNIKTCQFSPGKVNILLLHVSSITETQL